MRSTKIYAYKANKLKGENQILDNIAHFAKERKQGIDSIKQ